MNKTQEKSASGKEFKRMSAKEIQKNLLRILDFQIRHYQEAMDKNSEYEGNVQHAYISYLTIAWCCHEAGIKETELKRYEKIAQQSYNEWIRNRNND